MTSLASDLLADSVVSPLTATSLQIWRIYYFTSWTNPACLQFVKHKNWRAGKLTLNVSQSGTAI